MEIFLGTTWLPDDQMVCLLNPKGKNNNFEDVWHRLLKHHCQRIVLLPGVLPQPLISFWILCSMQTPLSMIRPTFFMVPRFKCTSAALSNTRFMYSSNPTISPVKQWNVSFNHVDHMFLAKSFLNLRIFKPRKSWNWKFYKIEKSRKLDKCEKSPKSKKLEKSRKWKIALEIGQNRKIAKIENCRNTKNREM